MFNPLAAPDSVPGALYKPGPDDEFSFIGISHCWESREHPDPFGYQPLELSKYTVLLRWFVFLQSDGI